MPYQRPPTLYCLLGPPAVGKSTLFRRIQVGNADVEHLGLHPLVSYTTRPPRADDIDGVDYHFVNDRRFHANFGNERANRFVTQVGEHQYGISEDTVRNHLAAGKHGLIVLNNEGFRKVKEGMPGIPVFGIFLMPRSVRRVIDTLNARANGGDATSRINYAYAEIEGVSVSDEVIDAHTQTSTFAEACSVIELHQQG